MVWWEILCLWMGVMRVWVRFAVPEREVAGHDVTADTFAWNTRAVLDYHRQVFKHITGIESPRSCEDYFA